MIYVLLFWEFCKIGLFCVGGGYASMPLIQHSVVDTYHWLSMREFIDIFTISQMTPGPIGINAATFVGTKIAGVGGAIVATLGFVTPALIIGLFLATFFLKYGNIGPIRGALNGLRPAVIALICGASLSFIFLAVWNSEVLPHDFSTFSAGGLGVFLIALIAVRRHVGVITVLLGSGILGVALGFLGIITV